MLSVGSAFRSSMSLALPAVLPALTSLLSPSEPTVVEVIGPRVPGVKLLAVIYSGSADDPAGKEGLAFLTAQLMRREAADRAGALAGDLRLSVGKDLIVLDAEASREDAGRLIEVFETILLKPTSDSAGMEAQRAEQ